jgi:DNA-binding transcriptional LysR family regulator
MRFLPLFPLPLDRSELADLNAFVLLADHLSFRAASTQLGVTLHSILMGPMKVAVVGAPGYFERRRPPGTLDDLASHSCIQYCFTTSGLLCHSRLSGTARPSG